MHQIWNAGGSVQNASQEFCNRDQKAKPLRAGNGGGGRVDRARVGGANHAHAQAAQLAHERGQVGHFDDEFVSLINELE